MGRRRNLRRRPACRTDHARRRRPWPRRFDRLVFAGRTPESQRHPGGARSESGADGDFDGISRSSSAAREAKAAQGSRVRRTLPSLSEPRATLGQINLVVQDMEQTLDFYRRLGLTIKDPIEWPPGSGARHTSVSMANGFGLEFDNMAGARTWNPPLDEVPAHGGRVVIGFALPSSTAVDQLHAELTGAGYRSRLAPHDAFWGGCDAIRVDPHTNHGGLVGPVPPPRGFSPGLSPLPRR